MAPGLETCGNCGGWGSWGTMGKAESYHLPSFSRSREKILVLPPRPPFLDHLSACLPACLWRSMQQNLVPQAWPQSCPQTQSITVWSDSKPDCNLLT